MTEPRRVRVALEGTVHTGRRESDQIVLDDGRTIAESDAVYLAPVQPSKIIAVHLTYRSRIDEYKAHFANPYIAAERGYIDDVISPADTRAVINRSLDILASKREELPRRKHGNVPL